MHATGDSVTLMAMGAFATALKVALMIVLLGTLAVIPVLWTAGLL